MPPKERFRFTGNVLEEAERKLEKPSATVATVAADIGCDPQSLRHALRLRREGKAKGKVDERIRHREDVKSRLYGGESVPEIANRYGVTKQAMYSLIKRMGINIKEIRKEARERRSPRQREGE